MLCIVFTALSVYTIVPQVSAWNRALAPARPVWDIKAGMHTQIVAANEDYVMLQFR